MIFKPKFRFYNQFATHSAYSEFYTYIKNGDLLNFVGA